MVYIGLYSSQCTKLTYFPETVTQTFIEDTMLEGVHVTHNTEELKPYGNKISTKLDTNQLKSQSKDYLEGNENTRPTKRP